MVAYLQFGMLCQLLLGGAQGFLVAVLVKTRQYRAYPAFTAYVAGLLVTSAIEADVFWITKNGPAYGYVWLAVNAIEAGLKTAVVCELWGVKRGKWYGILATLALSQVRFENVWLLTVFAALIVFGALLSLMRTGSNATIAIGLAIITFFPSLFYRLDLGGWVTFVPTFAAITAVGIWLTGLPASTSPQEQ